MKKSKYVFIIFALVYVAMAILYPFNVLNIGENLLFALSFSALLLSTSDVISKIAGYLCISNTYNADLMITIDFLESKIQYGLTQTRTINVRNVMGNCKELLKKKYKYCHPEDYAHKTIIKIQNVLSMILFIIGIASFIIIPFLNQNITNTKTTSIITILAFSAMSLSLFLDELIGEKQSEINILINDKHLAINAEYPDFRSFFESNMYYRNDLIAIQEAATPNEAENNGCTK
ncbi:hypothetical protein [Ruminococcus sp.]|uniref:hypothetical protein n=1 Tax=Ruminococcus sp. TaxID=41978 RepID=UPI0025F2FE34|nr:hypothetical protein [Ruminococcus sp.]MCR4638479.1 hypothetical protein [Ruminococcus sp.]